MSLKMKIKSLLLTLLAVLLLDCTQNTIKESKNVDSLNETKEGSLPTKKHEKNTPLEQLKLTSVLYDLAIASEPEQFAKKHGISLLNDKVRVFIYFTPESLNSERKKVIETHHIKVEKQSNGLARAWVPLNRLVPLSREPVIQFIRLPKTFIKTNGKSDV
jgi:hypothetical protein